jgi:hypothetical protein
MGRCFRFRKQNATRRCNAFQLAPFGAPNLHAFTPTAKAGVWGLGFALTERHYTRKWRFHLKTGSLVAAPHRISPTSRDPEKRREPGRIAIAETGWLKKTDS